MKFKFVSKIGSFGFGPRRKQVCMPGGVCEFDIEDPQQVAYMDGLRKAYGEDCFKPLASDGSEPPEPEDLDAMLARALRAEAEAKRLRVERDHALEQVAKLRAELRDQGAAADKRLAEAFDRIAELEATVPGEVLEAEGDLLDVGPIRDGIAGLAARLRASGGAGVSKADAAEELDALLARLPAPEPEA